MSRGPSSAAIRESLEAQLREKGADVAVYQSLLDDYMRYWRMEKDLQADIKHRGVNATYTSAAGKEYEKQNPSIAAALQCNKQKLLILDKLGLTTSNCRITLDTGCDDL